MLGFDMAYKARPIAERFWEKVDKSGDCWIWLAARHGSGYGNFMVKKGVLEGAHRVSFRLTFGAIPDGLQVLHRCDNRVCVRPDHLFAGTQHDNMHDMISKGRAAIGDALNHRSQLGALNNGAQLSEDVVREFKMRLKRGERRAAVARELGITRANAWAIVHGKSWTHV